MTDRTDSKNKTSKKKKRSWPKRIILTLVGLILALLVVGSLTACVLVINAYRDLDEFSAIEQQDRSILYDSAGNQIVEIRGAENREIIDYDQIPTALVDALIATEDTRFYKHSGIDFIRIFGALIVDLKSGSASQGASTLTMQLARNAILESQKKVLSRKIQEALLALQIERQYSKDEILTMYLNEVYMGEGAYGIQMAATRYFSKDASELTVGECATIVGLLKFPEGYNPISDIEKATSVRNTVLNNMVRNGSLTQAEADTYASEKLVVKPKDIGESIDSFSWFADYAIKEADDILFDLGYSEGKVYTGGFRIFTTMDEDAQDAADETYANDSLFPKGVGTDLLESAAVFIDPNTGEIQAMEGGRRYETRIGLNRATGMTRQPGSIIKPLAVYGAALDAGVSPNILLNDKIVSYGKYTPKNYDGVYRGKITMTTALKYSVNVTAVALLNQIGVETGWNFAKKLGLPLTETDKNLSLALGGITEGVSPLQLATGYSCFANGGYYIEPTSITKITDRNGNVIYEHEVKKTRVMSEETAYIMNTMLKETIKSGTGKKGNIGRPAAGKTGTTQLPEEMGNRKGNKDSWWAGYTPDMVGIVWMGFDENKDANGKFQYMVNVFGGQYPVVIWKNVMLAALTGEPESDWEKPQGFSKSINTTDPSSSSKSSSKKSDTDKEKDKDTGTDTDTDTDKNTDNGSDSGNNGGSDTGGGTGNGNDNGGGGGNGNGNGTETPPPTTPTNPNTNTNTTTQQQWEDEISLRSLLTGFVYGNPTANAGTGLKEWLDRFIA